MRKLLGAVLMLVMSATLVQAEDYDVFRNVMEKVRTDSPSKVSYEQMSIWAMQGLRQMDGNLRFGTQAGRITVYYKNKMVKSRVYPQSDEVQDWADYMALLLEDVKGVSDAVSLRDFEAADEMMAAVASGLKDDSKYYKAMDLVDDDSFVPKRSFLSYPLKNNLYVRLGIFDDDSAKNLQQAIEKNGAATGLILDLRGNSGGSLAAMTEIADMFLDEGIIVSARFGAKNEEKFYTSEEGEIWSNKPIVVLVDAGTASSAEALSLSLKEQGRAKIIGTRTYGKSTVQELGELDNGSKFSLTIAKIFGPSGAEIAKSGLNPDLCLAYMGEDQNISYLLRQRPVADCPKQKRESKELDVRTAEALLK